MISLIIKFVYKLLSLSYLINKILSRHCFLERYAMTISYRVKILLSRTLKKYIVNPFLKNIV